MIAKRVLVTGAGGFIGHHLVKYLMDKGHWVRGVDIKCPEYEPSSADEFEILDLRRLDNCLIATGRVEGIFRLMRSDHHQPLNLGTDELVTVNQLVEMVCQIAGKRLVKRHDLSKPQGVRGRNSDNTRLRQVLGWEPQVSLRAGLAPTYRWIESELRAASRIPSAV
jgi:nucleoside-diphosphate-sugar epimerase